MIVIDPDILGLAVVSRSREQIGMARSQGAMKCSRTELALRDAVAQLSDRQRAMIYRSYYVGRTTTQIAAELSTNDAVVKEELHRALHALRTNLQSAGKPPLR